MTEIISLVEQTEIHRPAAALWRIVADYRRDPQWRAGVKTMAPRPADLVRVGTTTAEELRFAGQTFHNGGEVTSVDDGKSFTWRTLSGVKARGARHVTALDEERCRVTLELYVTPEGGMRVMAPVVARMLAKTLRDDLARLRRLAETPDVHESSPRSRA